MKMFEDCVEKNYMACIEEFSKRLDNNLSKSLNKRVSIKYHELVKKIKSKFTRKKHYWSEWEDCDSDDEDDEYVWEYK